MGLFKRILDLLFGKDPDIFDDQGNVSHSLPSKTWENWANKNKANPQNNWRNHAGTKFKKR